MSAKIEKLAETLASRNYAIELLVDENQEDGQIYFATNPELKGCMAQGATVTEAIENLFDARVDYIKSLLADGLNVPEPFSDLPSTSITTTNQVDSDYQIIQKTYYHSRSRKTKNNRAEVVQISSC